MATRKHDGGPAFPQITTERHGWPQAHGGLSIRDYMAGQAMQGFVSDPDYLPGVGDAYAPEIAKAAYQMADAMLAARDAEGGE